MSEFTGKPAGGVAPATRDDELKAVFERELEHHEALYSGEAQELFRQRAVRLLRANMVRRILSQCPTGSGGRVLSLGCGIGDTEILLASHVREVVGIDLSPSGIRQAQADAREAGCGNARFAVGSVDGIEGEYDLAIAIFFLHHLPADVIEETMETVFAHLRPGGWFYALDPNRYRLSGAVGKILIPKLMRHYQTEDESPLDPAGTLELVRRAGFGGRLGMYDMFSSPAAGLFPSQGWLYRASRWADDILVRIPVLSRVGSNFEIIARKPSG